MDREKTNDVVQNEVSKRVLGSYKKLEDYQQKLQEARSNEEEEDEDITATPALDEKPHLSTIGLMLINILNVHGLLFFLFSG